MKWSWQVGQGENETLVEPLRADRRILSAIEKGLGQWSEPPPSISRSQIQKWIEEGRVHADGNPLKANQKLPAGALVTVDCPPPRPLDLVPENRPIEILFEDEHIVVVNKAPGLTVHPSDTQMEGTLVHALLHHVKDLSGIGGVMRPGIVHRLDKDTSGVLVVTKTDQAHHELARVFAAHEIERRYWAICYGRLETEARVESLIARNPNDRRRMTTEVKEGRRAVTHVRRIEAYGTSGKKPFASLIEATLETGRTHQVRVHLTSKGHSLLGDPLYGTPSERQPKWQELPEEIRERVRALPGQALHARILGFKHPVSGENLRFEAEPPEAFRLLLESLRRYL